MTRVDEVRCTKCRRPYKEHGPGGKCLFDASVFDSPELRVALEKDINAEALEREALEEAWGEVWDTKQVQQVFKIHGFLAPFVSATRLADGAKGLLTFQHMPRYYFAFMAQT
jgi:hypothetical protein